MTRVTLLQLSEFPTWARAGAQARLHFWASCAQVCSELHPPAGSHRGLLSGEFILSYPQPDN